MGRPVKCTTADIRLCIHNETNGEYELIGEYQGSAKPIRIKHLKCGHEWDVIAKKFIYDATRCPVCAREQTRKSHDEFSSDVERLTHGDYCVLGTYINYNTQIRIKHLKCGTEYDITPGNFYAGKRCPHCQHRSIRYTTDEYRQLMIKNDRDDYELIDEYQTAKTKIKFLHKSCGREFMMAPDKFNRGEGCPYCKCASKAEKFIAKILDKYNIVYVRQYKFPNCKNINPLPFDFYIPGINLAIEYDGEQHFYPIDYFGGEEAFKDRVYWDNYKTEYCKIHDIKLLRITYLDDIKQTLMEGLNL